MTGDRLIAPVGNVRLSFAAIGDVGIIGRARARAQRDGYDAVLAALAPAVSAGAFGFANLEMPMAEPRYLRPGRSPEFWQAPAVAPALRRAGVRVVSLANNHVMDGGSAGLEQTIEACRNAGLEVAGAGRNLLAARVPATLDVGGVTVRLLAYSSPSRDQAGPDTPGFAPLDAALIEEDLARWRSSSDVVIVSAHWGSMYVDQPPRRVTDMARLALAHGAAVVLGHHPHVLQGYGVSAEGLALYSLGDAVFDAGAGDFAARTGAETRRESGVFTVDVAERHGLRYLPLHLDADGVPVATEAGRGAAQRARLERLSAELAEDGDAFSVASAGTLLRYEFESLGHYLRQGRWGKAVRLLASMRPRHLPLLWQGLTRLRRRS